MRVVDLFSGAGGLSHGFEKAGFEIVAGTDHDPDAMATFEANFPRAIAVTGDIRDPEIQARIVEAGASADVIVGGPPCQAFSQVRNHTRIIDDPRNSLYREFVRIVGRIEPQAFVMENVLGMAQMGVKEQVLADLSLGGRYQVTAQILDAADFGVPQTRKRLIFIGLHRDIASTIPDLVGSGASVALTLMPDSAAQRGYRLGLRTDVVAEELLHRLSDEADLGVVSASQAIGDFSLLAAGNPALPISVNQLPKTPSAYAQSMRTVETIHNLRVPRINEDTRMRLESIPAGGNYLDLPESLRARHLTGQKWGPTNGSNMLSRKHYYAYRRLHPELWAWTLNTKADAVYHYAAARALSVREFCRLQSFSDDFVVVTDARVGPIEGRIANGSAHSQYRQIGNAVPPLLAAAIASVVSQVIDVKSEISA